jgi:hypothetical protein
VGPGRGPHLGLLPTIKKEHTMKATYTKLKNGTWGLRVESAGPVGVGECITVAKKDGSTREEVVHAVVWSGRDRNSADSITTICALAPQDYTARNARKYLPRNLPCPNCKEPNRLTLADQARGYQCNGCADREEAAF